MKKTPFLRSLLARTVHVVPTCSLLLATVAGMALAVYENNSDKTTQLVQSAYENPRAEQLEQLGDIYASGDGVQKDIAEAITWYCFAMQEGSSTATEKLWKLENSLRKKPIKRLRPGKAYNDKATLDLCRYLYIVNKGDHALVPKEIVPQGIKAEAAAATGFVNPPAYNPAIVRKYLSAGADPNAKPTLGDPQNPQTKGDPKAAVIRQRDYKTFDFMIAHGACVNDANNSLLARGLNDINSHGKSQGKPTDKTLSYLLARGASLKNKGNWGNNLLMLCVAGNDNPDGINFLVAKGADVNEEIEARYLPLCNRKKLVLGTRTILMAVLNRNVRAIDALIKAGADLNYLHEGKTMLDYALKAQWEDEQKESSYEKELARLLKEKAKGSMAEASVAHLLRLAGAKKAADLIDAPEGEKGN